MKKSLLTLALIILQYSLFAQFTWTPQTSGVSTTLNGIYYGGSQFIVTGSSGVILTSPNGTAWTQRTSGVLSGLNFAAFGN